MKKQKDLSVIAQSMLDILNSEEARQLRVERYNRKMKAREREK